MKRVIFLVDMNAFFISCELTRNPALKGKPAAVAGDPKKRAGIILTANYEARKFGVKTAMVLQEALKLCPNMQIVPSDHYFYKQKSKEVMNILYRYTPVIEQNSIDEAWLDMTGCERLFGKPIESARSIMKSIQSELGLWCSIGISYNKFLAKMASEMKKPSGITQLWEEDIQMKLWPLPVKSMYGVGKQTAHKLNNMGVETIGDLALFNKKTLIKNLGKVAHDIQQCVNGIDSSPVIPRTEDDIKSIGRSTTLAQDISDTETAIKVLIKLAEEVGTCARKRNKRGRTVQITIKSNDFKVITRQATIPTTYLTKDIYTAGIKLLKQNWNPLQAIRLLGISLGGFAEEYEMDQISIFQLNKIEQSQDKEEKLEKAIDAIRSKHGSEKIRRALLLKGND